MDQRSELNQGRFQDRELLCVDCLNKFIFTSGEQVYYASKLLSTPKRCPRCRRFRRQSLVPDREGRP